MWKKLIRPGEKVPLKLTARERKLVLEDLISLDEDCEQLIQATPKGKPVMMTLDELDDFADYIATESNHCDDKKKRKMFDAVLQKIQDPIEMYTGEEQPKTVNIEDARKAKAISDSAVHIAQWVAEALAAAELLRIKTKPIGQFPLPESERSVLAILPIRPKFKKKLLEDSTDFTVADVASMAMTVAETLPDAEPVQQVALLMVAKSLMACLQERIVEIGEQKMGKGKKPKAKSKAVPTTLFQFKVTLIESTPAIWRRIQVQDCTLDKLHEHIQTAMGWTNSHLHQFEVKGERYGDPELLDDGLDDFEYVDSTTTMISDIVPKSGKRFAFKYEYDFGDSWEHEVLFEGCPPLEKGKKYPICLEGERACPPEDVGGVWSYENFLAAIADPKHEEHENLLEWCGGSFSPDEFDPMNASSDMKKGLPDWRRM